MPGWVASASASRRGSQASIASPVTVEIRAGMPEPIAGPAVGAIEPTTSISLSVTAAVSRRVESAHLRLSATGAATAGPSKRARTVRTGEYVGGASLKRRRAPDIPSIYDGAPRTSQRGAPAASKSKRTVTRRREVP